MDGRWVMVKPACPACRQRLANQERRIRDRVCAGVHRSVSVRGRYSRALVCLVSVLRPSLPLIGTSLDASVAQGLYKQVATGRKQRGHVLQARMLGIWKTLRQFGAHSGQRPLLKGCWHPSGIL